MRKRKSLLIIILLLLVGVSTSYVAGTYAKYTGEVSGSGTATVAKWAFETDNDITTIDVDLAQAYAASTLSAERIAPGTSGSFSIDLSNEHSEVGISWTLTLGTIANKPTNLTFYKDANHTAPLTSSNSTVTGKLAAGDTTGLTVTIYWDWPYEIGSGSTLTSNDAADTTAGTAGNTLTVPVTITGVQIAPSTTGITSGIDQ